MNSSLNKAEIIIRTFNKSHDRFLIIDNKTVYHIGASLKDLGKKWFAFSKINIDAGEIFTGSAKVFGAKVVATFIGLGTSVIVARDYRAEACQNYSATADSTNFLTNFGFISL